MPYTWRQLGENIQNWIKFDQMVKILEIFSVFVKNLTWMDPKINFSFKILNEKNENALKSYQYIVGRPLLRE